MEGSMTRGCERGLSAALVAGTMRAAVAILLENILKNCEKDCRGPEGRGEDRGLLLLKLYYGGGDV